MAKRSGEKSGAPIRLPIKLILPKQGKERRVPGGGPAGEPFRDVTTSYRASLRNQVASIRSAAAAHAARVGAVPVRVKLIPKAAAKSHRPDQLFSAAGCPIIGAGRLGELYLKGTPAGLGRLASQIEHNRTARVVKELSAIETIEPVTPQLRRGGQAPADILRHSPRRGEGFMTRVRLFDYGNEKDQARVVDDFSSICRANKMRVSQEGYSARSYVYAVECDSADDVAKLSGVIGVRSIAKMPIMRTVRTRMFDALPLVVDLPLASEFDGDYPVVVVVDSGVSTELPSLESWVVGRDSDVAEEYRNPDHGTFVAGLISWGNYLNPNLTGIGDGPCGIFDLQLIPNSDPAKGQTDTVTEAEFLQSLEKALREHANDFKVWNLSIGLDQVCSLDEFSPLAVELDNLQERYQVQFVIAAGNYQTVPLLDYPRTSDQMDLGRITSPADSVLGITVGSLSHINYAKKGPKVHCPSAFSRHGAGPNYVIKPDLIHYGGTCSTDFVHQTGIRSVNGTGTAENLGTSFATPIVSRTLAQIFHQITPSPSPVVARALLTHHARDPRTGGRVPDREENFFGFGRPEPPPYCLECTPFSSTLVFEDTLRPGYFLEWDDFPYPPSLHRHGRYFGEIWMTVAFSPSRGERWGTEYCETHIDAHFGVYFSQRSRETGAVTRKFRGLVPPEHRNPGLLYESYQVANLRKWAPVRTYYGHLGDGGERGDRWRLMVRLLTRHGIEDEESFKPQPFSLIVTIADPEKKIDVYDEMARVVRTRFQAENLAVRTPVRVRVGS